MEKALQELLSVQDRCIQLCESIKACLLDERTALIQVRMEELLLNNQQKEGLHFRLREERLELDRQLKEVFGVATFADLEPLLNDVMKEKWQQSLLQWQSCWNEIRSLCEVNQRFMKHSLRNMGLLVENFRRLIGSGSTYTNKGQRLDSTTHGKVVEASY